MARGFMDTNPYGEEKLPRLDEVFNLYKIPKEFSEVRFVGPIITSGGFWIDVESKTGGKATFYKPCRGIDEETGELDGDKCPYFKSNLFGLPKRFFIISAIIMDSVEEGNSLRKSVKQIRLTPSLVEKLKSFVGLNKGKDISDPKYGRKVFIRFDPDKPGTSMYDAQIGDRYPVDVDKLKLPKLVGRIPHESFDAGKAEIEKILPRLWRDKKDIKAGTSGYESSEQSEVPVKKKRRNKKSRRIKNPLKEI